MEQVSSVIRCRTLMSLLNRFILFSQKTCAFSPHLVAALRRWLKRCCWCSEKQTCRTSSRRSSKSLKTSQEVWWRWRRQRTVGANLTALVSQQITKMHILFVWMQQTRPELHRVFHLPSPQCCCWASRDPWWLWWWKLRKLLTPPPSTSLKLWKECSLPLKHLWRRRCRFDVVFFSPHCRFQRLFLTAGWVNVVAERRERTAALSCH